MITPILCENSIERSSGLQFWDRLPEDHILIFPIDRTTMFHMNNVKFPIGIASVLENDDNFELSDKVKLEQDQFYNSVDGSKYVVEFNPGVIDSIEDIMREVDFNNLGRCKRHRDIAHEFITQPNLSSCPFKPMTYDEVERCQDPFFELTLDSKGTIGDAARVVKLNACRKYCGSGLVGRPRIVRSKFVGKVEHTKVKVVYAKPDIIAGDFFNDGDNHIVLVDSIEDGIVNYSVGANKEEAVKNKAEKRLLEAPIEDFRNFELVDRTVLMQTFDYTCGPAAIKYVLSYLGTAPLTEDEIAKAVKANEDDGAFLDDMIKFIKDQQLEADKEIGNPFQQDYDNNIIIALIKDRGTDHYVVILNATNDYVLFFDPFDSGTKRLDSKAFSKLLEDSNDTSMIKVKK